jgi:AcrR family transcriptional regulator
MTVQTGDRRTQIVAAAYQAIVREGVAAITTRKLAAEAGVNLATLHALFGSKDALLVAVLDQVTGRIVEALAPPALGRQGLRAAVAESSAALWALIDREPRLLVVRCELLLYLVRRPARAEQARVQQGRYLAMLTDRYRHGRARAAGRVGCATLAQLVASQLDGLALHGALGEAAHTPRQIRTQALRAVLALLEEAVPPTGTRPSAEHGSRLGADRYHQPTSRANAPGVGRARQEEDHARNRPS